MYVYLRVLNQYGTHWNKNTPTTAMIRTVGQLKHVLNLYFSGNSFNNLSSYCGLTDSRMRASDTDLPVCTVRPTEVVPRRGLQILSIEYVIERV